MTAGPGDRPPRRIEAAVVAAAAAGIVALCFVRWPVFVHPSLLSDSPIDAAFFGYAGELVRQGGVPYVAFWDHKPPLIFFLNSAALTLSGGAPWGIWLFGVLGFLVALVLGHLVMRRWFGPLPAILGTVFFAAALPTILAINMTEGYVLPFQWLAIAALVWRGRAGAPLRTGLWIGAAGACALLLRPNLVAAGTVAGIVAVVLAWRERGAAGAARVAAGGVAGAGLVVGAVLLYFAAHGALGAFYDQVIHYNGLYTDVTWKLRLRSSFFGTRYAASGVALALPTAAWLALLVAAVRNPATRRAPAVLTALLWFPLEALFDGASGRPYGHYFMPLFSPMALLTAGLAYLMLGWVPAVAAGAGRGSVALRPATLVLLLAAVLVVPVLITVAWDVRDNGLPRARARQVLATAEYLRRQSRPDEPVLVWGHAADVYYFAERRPPTRYVYPSPLFDPRYTDEAKIAEYLGELRAARPELIVDATHRVRLWDDLVPALDSFYVAWRVPPERNLRVWWRMPLAMRSVYDWVASNYEVVDSVGPDRWPVYRRRPVPVMARAPVAWPKPVAASTALRAAPHAAPRTATTSAAARAGASVPAATRAVAEKARP